MMCVAFIHILSTVSFDILIGTIDLNKIYRIGERKEGRKEAREERRREGRSEGGKEGREGRKKGRKDVTV